MGKGISVYAMVAMFVLAGLGYQLVSEQSASRVFDALVEKAKVEIGQLVSDVLPDEFADLLPDGVPTSPMGSGPSTAKGAPVPPSAAVAREQLAGLDVAPAGSMSTYDREAFAHWSNAQEFGWRVADSSCDTRDAALLRDGRKVVVGEYCDVESGRWVDPYTGNVYTDPADMDIDHVVALGNAWRSGASRWTDARREAYANDPEVLLTAEDDANQEKSDYGPEEWVPPNGDYHCEYSRRYVSIKSDWRLTTTGAEKAALREMLSTC